MGNPGNSLTLSFLFSKTKILMSTSQGYEDNEMRTSVKCSAYDMYVQ